MSRISTIQALFAHHDWAEDRLFTAAANLTDAQLDQPFEMGPGSLRAVLKHVYFASRIWHERWHGDKLADPPPADAIGSLDDLRRATRMLDGLRDAAINHLSDADLDRAISYKNLRGEPHADPLEDILLHVANHAVHHRAQAANMLRHLGVKPPRTDYIFMKLERRDDPPIEFDLAMIRRCCAASDWAQERVLAAAETLDDAALDRPFEMGLGTLRKTLVHVNDAEQFWVDHWQGRGRIGFPEADGTMSPGDIRAARRRTIAARDAHLAALGDARLNDVVTVTPTPDRKIDFMLGDTLLQLSACHGTHHRAQAVNMLRHLGIKPPVTDRIAMKRPGA